jgi:hypothetical protein
VVVVLVVVLVVVDVTVAVVVVVDVVASTVVVVSEVDVVVTIVVRVVADEDVTDEVLDEDVDDVEEVVVPGTLLDVVALELVVVELLVLVDELVVVVVPGTGSGASKAPTSHSAVMSPLPSMGRPIPRWSTGGVGHCAAASIAGLAGRSACVKVPSPSSASAASCGFVPV